MSAASVTATATAAGSAALTILTSAVGLGAYIPALLIARQLRVARRVVNVEVIEDFYTAEKQRAHSAHRDAHHQSFALAQIAHRMARSTEDSLDEARVARLIESWREQSCSQFVVWCGFWLPVIERYRAFVPQCTLRVDHCRIDAVVSASFKVHPALDRLGQEIWLWHGQSQRLVHEIPVTDAPFIPFEQRPRRLVVHGGGWGIGTYQQMCPELRAAQWHLDMVVHGADEAADAAAADYRFVLDPAWSPRLRDAGGRLTFPPMIQLSGTPMPDLGSKRARYHDLFDVIARARAIVSKPGGCTLIDSLASGTPVILLEAYGYAERSNAEVWIALGYGITFEAWRDSGFSSDVLQRLHENLQNRDRNTINYPQSLLSPEPAPVLA